MKNTKFYNCPSNALYTQTFRSWDTEILLCKSIHGVCTVKVFVGKELLLCKTYDKKNALFYAKRLYKSLVLETIDAYCDFRYTFKGGK